MKHLLLSGFTLLISGCAPEDDYTSHKTIEESTSQIDCGDIIESKVVSELFFRIKDIARTEKINDEDRDLFRFPLIINSRSKSISINFDQIQSNTEEYISFEDFHQIASMEDGDVQSGGYRGCFLAHGKVWFELPADGDNLQITSFDKDMRW